MTEYQSSNYASMTNSKMSFTWTYFFFCAALIWSFFTGESIGVNDSIAFPHHNDLHNRNGIKNNDGVIRRLQFDELNMDKSQRLSDFSHSSNDGKHRRRKDRHQPRNNLETTKTSRSIALTKAVESILFEADRYHMWWTGPQQEPIVNFISEEWSAKHIPDVTQAVFTMAVIQGQNDNPACSSPNDLILFLGSLRRVFHGDIVIALEIDKLTKNMKKILEYYKAIVYLLPKDLCSKETNSIFCGSINERVPSSIFRYYFYEKWAAAYSETTKVLLTDFRDIIFQANPFEFHQDEWFPDFNLAVFQEFYPNMVINRCRFNRKIVSECYGEETLKLLGTKTIISSGAILGTRDAVIVWAHHMTMVRMLFDVFITSSALYYFDLLFPQCC